MHSKVELCPMRKFYFKVRVRVRETNRLKTYPHQNEETFCGLGIHVAKYISIQPADTKGEAANSRVEGLGLTPGF